MHTWFLRIWIPLFCILLAETFYCCSPVEAKEPVLLTRDGIRISYGNVHKSPYTLLYLIKPWDGFTVKIMEDLKKYERDFYGRVKPVVILSNTRRAVANSYMDSLNLKNTPFYIDDTFSVCQLFKPSTIPCVVLVSSNGEEIFRTTAPSEELLENLSSMAGYTISRLKKEKNEPLKLGISTSDVHGPWGPPAEKQPVPKVPEQ